MRNILRLHIFSADEGFSLLELMVAITASALIAGGGFFAFIQYSRSQSHSQTIENIRYAYTEARNSAISNVKVDRIGSTPTNCGTLMGYRVNLSATSYEIQIVCLNNTGSQVVTGNPVSLPSGIRLSGANQCSGLGYRVITGNVTTFSGSTTLPCTFEVLHDSDSSLRKTITIENDGNLTI